MGLCALLRDHNQRRKRFRRNISFRTPSAVGARCLVSFAATATARLESVGTRSLQAAPAALPVARHLNGTRRPSGPKGSDQRRGAADHRAERNARPVSARVYADAIALWKSALLPRGPHDA